MEQRKICEICNYHNDIIYLKCEICGTDISFINPTYEKDENNNEKQQSDRSPQRIKLVSKMDGYEIHIPLKGCVLGKVGDLCPEYFLKSRYISKEHVKIYLKDNQYIVYDERSTNGTTINQSIMEKRIEYSLSIGDTIVLADLEFLVCLDSCHSFNKQPQPYKAKILTPEKFSISKGAVANTISFEQSYSKMESKFSRQLIKERKYKSNQIQFSAIAPKKFIKGEYTLVDIIMYEENYRNIIDKVLKKLGLRGNETSTGFFEVAQQSKVYIVLESPDITIEDNVETTIWNGKFSTFQFQVFVPISYSGKQIFFIGKVYIDLIMITKIKFIAKVSSFKEQKMKIENSKRLSAFISYASQDRNKVVARIQGMKKIIPNLDIFFDVESLRSGQEWEPVLWDEIVRCDILYLFWSRYAKESAWVDKEWRFALENKGIDAIEPVPLEPPEICPPPEELATKHFNDWTLRYSSFEANDAHSER